MCTILAVGQDEGLLSTRSAILRKCNAGVVAARASEAIQILKAQRFDLVVLCHTVTSVDMNELASLAHHKANDMRVLEILKATELNWGSRCPGADDMVLSKPETLVAKVREMLSAQVLTY
jgi:CheY-like chemotaxis protein